MFYGPPGTGKTLTATLLGKRTQRPVYRVDLSAVVSKYIGETEKNLARLFDRAGQHNWILFFDEADALFGTRTEARSSNDRHSNQETAYLLQRIEEFPGTVLLATNLKDNLDEAFSRRFQSVLHFPMPDEEARYQLWRGMLPDCWLGGEAEALLRELSRHPLSGGSMVNVLRSCAVRLHAAGQQEATTGLFRNTIEKELEKEGKIVAAQG
ncbi:MAG: ATP-binding protein [Bacteroides sp.]|nr:ATP-binding protein [Bacteroides sp.]